MSETFLIEMLQFTQNPKSGQSLPSNQIPGIDVIPGDDKSRCPTNIPTVEKLQERVQRYSTEQQKAYIKQDGHTFKKMSEFLGRLKNIRDQKFPNENVLITNIYDQEFEWPESGYAGGQLITSSKKALNPGATVDYEKALKRIDNRIETMEEKAHAKKLHNISIYNNSWANRITDLYLKEVNTSLSRKGYRLKSSMGTPDDQYSFHEKSWRFFNPQSNDEIVFAMLSDKSWVFDIFHNGIRTPYMIMNPSRAGQKSQGVPISMRHKTFAGVYAPSEARLYKSNWRRVMKWVYKL